MGTLTFQVHFDRDNYVGQLALPVEIRRPNLTLAAQGLTSEQFTLTPGTYFVTAQLPAGQELSNSVEVSAEKNSLVVLSPEPAAESPHEWQAQHHYLIASRNVALAANSIAPIWLRYFAGNLLGGDLTAGTPDWQMISNGDGLIEYHVLSAPDAQIVQLLQPKAPPLNMLLPAIGGGCRLTVTRQAQGACTLDAHLNNGEADLLLRYSQRGLLQQAEIACRAVEAESLLRQKVVDPLAAAAGAYALLRFGVLGKLHDWTENLRAWFPGFPDGAAIHGEHLARLGEHPAALKAFLELAQRGVPLFSDGLSYAVDRLRLYTQLNETALPFSATERTAAKILMKKLQQLASFTDFREPFTTFTGLQPAQPDDKKLIDPAIPATALEIGALL